MIDEARFDEFSEAFQKVAVDEARAYKEMEEAKDVLDALGYTIEMATISEHGGDEKKVGPTETARQRAYAIAKEKSQAYREAREFYLSAKVDYRYHKNMLRLMDLRGQFFIASMKP